MSVAEIAASTKRSKDVAKETSSGTAEGTSSCVEIVIDLLSVPTVGASAENSSDVVNSLDSGETASQMSSQET